MKHKVVVIGAGYFGQRHIKMLSSMPDVEIVAVVDSNMEKAKEVASNYNVKYFTDYKSTLELGEVFFVVTPTTTHFEIAMDLLVQGKDVFVEKPLTENPLLAKKLISQAIEKGKIFQVGLIERYNPAFLTALNYIKEPLFIEAERVTPFVGRATDTDVIFDLMIHDLDLLWCIVKKINLKTLKIFKKSIVTEKIDVALLWLDFISDGKSIGAYLKSSRIGAYPSRKFTVIQQDNAIYIDLASKAVILIEKNGKTREVEVLNKDSQPLYDEIRDFLECVKQRSLSKKAASFDDVVEVIDLINKIKEGEN